MADIDATHVLTELACHPRWQPDATPVGRGSFGIVFRCRDATMPRGADGEYRAIKVVKRGSDNFKKGYALSEVLTLYKLYHPHVVLYHDIFNTASYMCIVMEYVDGGDLFEHVRAHRGLDEPQARWLFQQLALALDFCHRNGVHLRDLKPENVLLKWDPANRARPFLKLADFGYAKDVVEQARRPAFWSCFVLFFLFRSDHTCMYTAPRAGGVARAAAGACPTCRMRDGVATAEQSACKSRVGTALYMAPEVAANRAREGQTFDGAAADMWSAGVVLYTMLFGALPFAVDEGPKWLLRLLDSIRRLDYHVPAGNAHNVVSEEAKALVRRLLAPVDARATLADVRREPWFNVGLPPGAFAVNDECMEQSLARNMAADREHIRRRVAAAATLGA